jgi:hypothetical protein
MSARILVSGGPHDGQLLTWDVSNPPDIISLPVPSEEPTGPPSTAHYWRGRDWDGCSLRGEDGAYVYEFRSETV